MTVFESKVELNRAASEVYNFLYDFNNHKDLMPNSISNWSSTPNEASFSIQNMANLVLKISNRIENQTIIISALDSPFAVEIRWVVASLGNNLSEAILTVSAELNMMMKVMASGPLQNFVNHQTESLKRLLVS